MRRYSYILLLLVTLANCTSKKNSNDFIKETTGRYLFNVNEVLEVYFKEKVLYVKWRGNERISPLKINDSSFYMNELNEKIVFVSLPKTHIELAPKREHENIKYHFKKMAEDEKTPNEYLAVKEFNNALKAFTAIKKKDSLNPVIKERQLNRLGYAHMNQKEYDLAIQVFKINTELYPKSSNTFDSLADAFLKKEDTLNAIENLKKALAINPENQRSKKRLERINKK
jgi:tetratricopeptide (TPR) repeat protein|tara:strand:- start:6895 stop:7575 length:681 start_codon:yes stop_codon:yes gene_type:complete